MTYIPIQGLEKKSGYIPIQGLPQIQADESAIPVDSNTSKDENIFVKALKAKNKLLETGAKFQEAIGATGETLSERSAGFLKTTKEKAEEIIFNIPPVKVITDIRGGMPTIEA